MLIGLENARNVPAEGDQIRHHAGAKGWRDGVPGIELQTIPQETSAVELLGHKLVLHHAAPLHDKPDALQDSDVGGRVPLHRDQIGELAGVD